MSFILKTTGAYLSYLRLYLSLVDFRPIPIACHPLVANLITLYHLVPCYMDVHNRFTSDPHGFPSFA
jgi:hypothetical protein